MTSIHPSNIDKPIENIHPDNTPDVKSSHMTTALSELVDHSEKEPDVGRTIHTPWHKVGSHPWLHEFIPGIENLAAKYHVGNYVIVRGTGEKFFESMPIYARIGMHLLFYGKEQVKLLSTRTVEDELKEQSIKEGKIYDDPKSAKSIPSFVKTYSLQLDELLNPDLSSYKTFNEFFYRRLKPDARPVEHLDNPDGFCSAADCRMTVYDTIDAAKTYWIKGNHFTLANLLQSEEKAAEFEGGSIAIFRLAPADYHRFHSPADATVGEVTDIPGQYYTVNPQAVNEPGFDVFTANKRSVLYLNHTRSGKDIAFVAIGALLVASVNWTKQKGDHVSRGEELGYFAYGGSTVVTVFPKGLIKFDEDIADNSLKAYETYVKVGYSLGTKAST